MHPLFFPAVAGLQWPPPHKAECRSLKQRLAEYERELILEALVVSRGHQRRAAEALGLLPSTLVEKMRRLRIPSARQIAGSRPPSDTIPR